MYSFSDGKVTTVINDYVDILFENLGSLTIQKGVDPYPLKDKVIKVT